MESSITTVPRREAYSIKEAACLLSVSERTTKYEIKSGRLGSINIGRRVLITQQQLTNYLLLKSQPIANTGSHLPVNYS